MIISFNFFSYQALGAILKEKYNNSAYIIRAFSSADGHYRYNRVLINQTEGYN